MRILTENNLSPKDVLCAGDTVNDWDAARKSGVRFIDPIKPGNPDRFKKLPFVENTISNLHEQITYIGGNKC